MYCSKTKETEIQEEKKRNHDEYIAAALQKVLRK